MNHSFKNHILPGVTLLCGGAGMLLRLWLFSTENSLGFIQQGHISQILLLLLTGIFLTALFFTVRSLRQGNKYAFNFPASPVSAVGSILAALGIGIACGTDLVTAAGNTMGVASAVVGLLAALSFLWSAKCRWEGSRASVLLHGCVCVWLMLRLLSLYRTWSADPQLEDYCFQLLALVLCMLAAYQRAAFAQGLGDRVRYSFFVLAGLYCCCLSLAGPDSILVYLSLGIWLATDLCDLTPMPREDRSEEV